MVSQIFQPSLMPRRPIASNSSFQAGSPMRRSAVDSSSGHASPTPRDGSDIGVQSKDGGNVMGSTFKARGHAKKPSVTFEDPLPIRGREGAKTDLTGKQRTRERRRSEAKATTELGKIVNGRGLLVHDDSDEDVGLRGRNSTINTTMGTGVHGMMPSGWAAWQQPMASMVSPQFSSDRAYLAAHQRALLIAKQAYQMVVAQHAMQMAGEEWERSSNIGFGRGSSVYGRGSSGSVYGGESRRSLYGGVAGMPSMGMLTPPTQWARSSVVFSGATGSIYGGVSSSQSEFGGAGGWGTRNVYMDSFGPSSSRSNYMRNDVPNNLASACRGSPRPRPRSSITLSSVSSGQPTRATGKSPGRGRAAPPSSWKNGRR